jgi:CRP-like cAMP-binding protein
MNRRRDHKLDDLAGLPLFAGCHPHELVTLARSFDTSTAASGSLLDREGAPTRWWTILSEGSASVSQDGCPTGLLGRGDWWGERSLMTGHPSTFTVVALTPVTLLTLDRRDFLNLPQRHPLVAGRIISLLADRLAPYERLAVA